MRNRFYNKTVIFFAINSFKLLVAYYIARTNTNSIIYLFLIHFTGSTTLFSRKKCNVQKNVIDFLNKGCQVMCEYFNVTFKKWHKIFQKMQMKEC